MRLPVHGRKAVAIMSALGLMAVAGACGGGSGSDAERRSPAPPPGRASGPATGSGAAPRPTPTSRVPELMRHLSLRQKVGQLFVPTIAGATPARGVALIKKYHLGGVIYFPANMRAPRQTAELSNALQRAALRSAGVPLLISTDEEQGIVSRVPFITRFPANRALAQTRDPEDDVRTAARVTAEELRALGINQDNAPDADVNVNPRNPVIGVRSFGTDPRQVARLVGIAVDAYRAAGVATVAKHFPGHGDTDTDSHTGLPVIDHTKSRWRRVDAPPFAAAIEHGTDAIMAGHIVMPHLDPSRRPATMSSTVLTGLLRGELGFDGVVVTDSMQMTGARLTYGPAEAAVRAIKAGADQLLMPVSLPATYAAVLKAVRAGTIPRARLDQAVTRILRMKERRGLFGSPYVNAARAAKVVGSREHRAAARRVAAHVRAS
ncbi:MAG TPA: glycoside hydrolase family 3 protein [Streptosporangiaceae bacterium]|nr:glycoside hydrolase family 3 protein [Streptosporangiaceae bacterium]